MSSVWLFSCQENENVNLQPQMRLSINQESLPLEEQLSNINAFLLNNESIVLKQTNMQANSEGVYVFATDKVTANKLLFIAGSHDVDFTSSFGTYTDLTMLTTQPADFETVLPKLFYTGEQSLSSVTSATIDLNLTRSVARLDLKKVTQLEVIVDSCVISNLADRSYLLPNNATAITDVEYKTQSLSANAFTELNSGIEGFAYMYETDGHAPSVTLYVRINGIKNKLNVELPEKIERNKKYEIAINSSGAVLYTNLNVLPWNEGSSSVVKPENFVPKIDLTNSVFPEGVNVSATQDTLSIRADFGGTFLLTLDAPTETEVKLESSHIAITPETSTKSTYRGNVFRFDVKQSDVNTPEVIAKMFVKSRTESQFYDKYIVVVKKGYRTRFEELSGTIAGNNIEYTDYKDGFLANIISDLPIASIATVSADDQFNWLGTTEADGIQFLEGGFKPNDRDAVGQKQSSLLSVQYADGVTEQFVMSRRRNSLPVVRLGGLYWAKYNMRGDSKNYTDQIGFDQDVDNLWEYLQNCTDAEYAYYAGAEYKGKSTQGLYLKNTDGRLSYEHYASIPNGQINNGTADAHCPSGYQIPSKAELTEIIATHVTMRIPDHGAENFYTTPANGFRYRLNRFRRNTVVVDGVAINNVDHIMLTDINRDESIVLNGFGHQYDSSSVAFGHWILALVNSGGTAYYGINPAGNSMSMQNQNDAKTRVIRCIKSPVSFIVE